jgi:hypothetical protein
VPLEPMPVNKAPELVFGLIAPIGVDLEVVSEVLDTTLREMRFQAHVLRVTQLMREIGIEPPVMSFDASLPEGSFVRSYRDRIAHANKIREVLRCDFALAALAISAIRAFRREERQRRFDEKAAVEERPSEEEPPEEEPIPSQAYIIRQLKRPEEVMLLREVYGRQFILISAYAPQEWRIQRIQEREKVSRGGLVEDIDAQMLARHLVLQDAKESQDSQGQNVRVRPQSSRGIAKPSEHQSNGCQTKERQRGPVEVLEVLRQPPTPAEPAKATFDDPSFR